MIATLCFLATPAVAQEAPRVVADIAPIRSLVAQIMDGVGSPSQLIPTGASPHGYAMRPSEARALGEAELVVWVGPALTHWLEDPLDTLSGDALRLTLMDHGGSKTLPMREAEYLGSHEHDHAEAHGDEGHADHAGHADHSEHEGHAEHKDHAAHVGHDHHGDIDPHGWLSPSNAVLWAGLIAQQLSEIDPDNAATYDTNWRTFTADVQSLEQELAAQMEPYRDTPFMVMHDAFQYFEATFGVEADAFIVPGDGSAPGPARIKALRDHLAEHPAVCAFTAPQENDALLRTALEGQPTRVAVLDPIGDGETPYGTLMRQFADNMVACFEGE